MDGITDVSVLEILNALCKEKVVFYPWDYLEYYFFKHTIDFRLGLMTRSVTDFEVRRIVGGEDGI